MPAVVTVHDVAWLRVQAHARPYARYYFGAFSIDRYRHARRIVVDSEFSRGELLDAASRLDAGRGGRSSTRASPTITCGWNAGPATVASILAIGTIEPSQESRAARAALVRLPEARVVAVGSAHRVCRRSARARAGAGRRRSPRVTRLRRTFRRARPLRERRGGRGAVALRGLRLRRRAGALRRHAGDRLRSARFPRWSATTRRSCRSIWTAWVTALGGQLRGDLDARAAEARARSIERFAWDANAAAMRAVYAEAIA